MNDRPPDVPTAPAFKVGDRVALMLDLRIYQLGEFPAGAQGTVTFVADATHQPTQPVGHVRLDEAFPELDHWENELQVWSAQDGEITWASFAPAAA